MNKNARRFSLAAALMLLPFPAFAAIDTGDTAWILMASALVLLMTPGLAFFYAGMVRNKNAASTLYQNVITVAVAGLLWAIIGFSLAFSEGSPYLGGTSLAFLKGVGQDGVGGLLGVLATGLFASTAVNSAASNGLLNGGNVLFTANLMAGVTIAIYSMVATFIIIKLVGFITPVRVSDADEALGLDASQHGESIHG